MESRIMHFHPCLVYCTGASGKASGGIPLLWCFTKLDRDSTAQCVAVLRVCREKQTRMMRNKNSDR